MVAGVQAARDGDPQILRVFSRLKATIAHSSSRHRHPAECARGRFLKECGFPVIYFVSNIFLPAPANSALARSCTTLG
jgi:hypothetical protein